jgi:glutamyl-tRNA synthetase
MGQGNKKLSKRDPEANALGYRDAGFLPEGLLNYIALLGWAIADDRDVFTVDEMVQAFDIGRVNPNPARFDLKKCEAINASHMRLLTVEQLTERLLPYLQEAGLVADPPTEEQRRILAGGVPLVHERIGKLTEGVDMLRFLLVDEADFTRDPADVEKLLDTDGRAVVKAAHDALAGLDTWTTESIDEALRSALVEDLGLKPRHAFGPVRVAVTGRRVSPPLFESLELLGRERSLARLAGAQETA